MTTLGVSASPTTGELRTARRRVARRLHPDIAGERGATSMAALNAACDEWIQEIRRGVSAQPAAVDPVAARPATGRLRPLDAVSTLALVAAVALVTVVLLGASVVSLAAGLLLGAGAGGVYLVVLHHLATRRGVARRQQA